ncbi:LysR family transcriptional regulator [Microbispora catharanthi]|uniref:LysR family transcriptional regulator n=1 Tax=Microbispora catharanthi TaxID=1712871 RepID=UPI001F111859|nr:LysR family transcriptional regulator [Microbispora catharanthi]
MHRLGVLREVARHGSFNRAAAALRFTPSAVSQQIAALERGLGVPVVQRSTRGVVLTEPGRMLVDAAEAIAAELTDAQERIDRLSTARARFTIAAFASGGRRLLPPALTRRRAPRGRADDPRTRTGGQPAPGPGGPCRSGPRLPLRRAPARPFR